MEVPHANSSMVGPVGWIMPKTSAKVPLLEAPNSGVPTFGQAARSCDAVGAGGRSARAERRREAKGDAARPIRRLLRLPGACG